MRQVWLTRPAGQADKLELALLELGFNVLHIPMLEIEPLKYDGALKTRILNLDQYDLAFFISSNAAKLGMECVHDYWPQYPAHLKNFALGPTSAAVLQSYDLEVSFPESIMSSEAVLELPALARELSRAEPKRVVIFRGEGGREALAEGLIEKGASVEYIELYRRNIPSYESQYLSACMQSSKPDAVVISSAEALDNFSTIFTSTASLYSLPLYVSSPRLKELALAKGFDTITVMPAANDAAVLAALSG